MRSVKRFFDEGDKVKVTLRFRGREMAHQDIGFELLQRVRTETAPIAKVEIRAPHGRPPDDHGAGAEIAPSGDVRGHAELKQPGAPPLAPRRRLRY